MAKSKNFYLKNYGKTLQITFDIWPKSVIWGVRGVDMIGESLRLCVQNACRERPL